jgi:hypothetical protein
VAKLVKAMAKIDDAKAHAHSLANEALAKMLVDGGVGKMLMDLAMMRPYLIELALRFKHLKKGETILGYTSMDGEDGFCLAELNRTYRACKYVMDGGNNKRKRTSPKPAPNPPQKQLTAGMPENKTENVSVSTEPIRFLNIDEAGEKGIIINGKKFKLAAFNGGFNSLDPIPNHNENAYTLELVVIPVDEQTAPTAAPEQPDAGTISPSGVSIPTSSLQFEVRPVEHRVAKAFIEKWHYSKRMPTGKNICFGAYLGDTLYAVADYGTGINPLQAPYLARVTGLPVDKSTLVELKRLCRIEPPMGLPLTRFLRICHLLLRKQGIKFVVSFSDPAYGHHGGVYKAANFKHLGKSNPEWHVV